MRRLLKTVVLLLLLVFGGILQAAEYPLSANGELRYDVYRGEDGFLLGEARHTWQRDGDRYLMALRLEPIKAIKTLYHFRYGQTTTGRLTDTGFQPELFRVTQKGRPEQTVAFDWQTQQLTITRKGKSHSEALLPGVVDLLSIWHTAELGGYQALLGKQQVATNRKIVTVTITNLGVEQLTLPIGKVAARHLTVRGEKIRVELWIAEQYRNLPVRIVLTDEKGGKLDVKLRRVKSEG